MGMFDYVYCYHKLRPIRINENNLISFAPGNEFQTKDLHNMMDSYILTVHGKLMYKEASWSDPKEIISVDYKDSKFHGILNFYTPYKSEQGLYMIDFYAVFKEGLLEYINHEVTKSKKPI